MGATKVLYTAALEKASLEQWPGFWRKCLLALMYGINLPIGTS